MTKRRRIYIPHIYQKIFYHENDEQTTSEIHFQSLPFPYHFFHARKRAYGMAVGRGDTDGSLKVVRKKKIGSSAGVPYENIFDVREFFYKY